MSGRFQPDEHEMAAIRREVMEFAGIGLYRYAFDGTIIFIDRGALCIFELENVYPDPLELAGHQIGELFQYTGPRGLIRGELRKHPRVRNFEYPFKTLNGKQKWVLHDSYLITDPITGEEVIQAIIRDITEQKEAEMALRKAEEQYRSIFENAGLGIFQSTPDGKIISVNPAYARIYGYASPEEVKEQINDVATQLYLDPSRRQYIVDYVLRHPGVAKFENQYRRKDGQIITANLTVRAVRDELGNFLYLEGFVEDVTERKEALEALEKERAFLSSTIDILPLPLLFISRNGELMRANAASTAFAEKYHIDKWDNVTWLNPDTRMPIPREQWPIVRSLRNGEVVSSAEGILVIPSGNEIPLLIYTAPIFIKGELAAAALAFQDITALKAADKAKTEFLSVLSHELKTPLTSILGWTQLAASTMDPEITKEALLVIERNAQRQRQILEDLIDVSRLVHGRLVIKSEPADLWVLAVQAYAEVEQDALTHHLTMRLEPPGVSLPVNADTRRIQQVIGDLLGNAIKFTPPEGSITISGYREDAWAVLAIHDTGRGIPPELLSTLFRPFRQVQRSELTGGLGLGLALVRGILELHGGDITATSPGPGFGSTFTIRLPLREDAGE